MRVVAVLYPGGAAAKETPELLGCVENALGLRPLLESRGHELIATSDTGAELDRLLPETDVLIATPFWPAYITRERIANAPKLRLLLTAGVGSDHFDLAAAAERGITVAEITGSNVVSVAEHVVMQILALVRNFIPSYQEVVRGGWDIGTIAARSHDLTYSQFIHGLKTLSIELDRKMLAEMAVNDQAGFAELAGKVKQAAATGQPSPVAHDQE